MSAEPDKFSFRINERGGILVATLNGPLRRSALAEFERCVELVSNSDVRGVILYFRGVSEIDGALMPVLAGLQKIVREKRAELRLCCLNLQLVKALSDRGLLRREELASDLAQAIESISEGQSV